jgi:hypothetical protein
MPTFDSPLTDDEAKKLIEMLKQSSKAAIAFPSSGKKKEFEVVGDSKRDVFIVNIFRGSIEVRKCNIGGRTKTGIMLLELHLTPTGVHSNPDGEKIIGPHLHIYTQEYGRAFAVPFDPEDKDIVENCIVFMDKFHIIKKPEILHQAPLA